MLEGDEYMSDLTEEDEDQAVKPTQSPSKRAKTRSGKGEVTGYKIQGALPAPRPTSYNAQHLYGQWKMSCFLVLCELILYQSNSIVGILVSMQNTREVRSYRREYLLHTDWLADVVWPVAKQIG